MTAIDGLRTSSQSIRGHSPRIAGYVWALALVAFATTLAGAFRGSLALADTVMLYVLAVIVSSAMHGWKPSALTAALSVAAYDFFFVPPVFSFAADDNRHFLTFMMMFGVSVTVSALTTRARRKEREARWGEDRSLALGELSRELAKSDDVPHTARTIVFHARRMFGAPAALMCRDPSGVARIVARAGNISFGEASFSAEAAFPYTCSAGVPTNHAPEAGVSYFPVHVGVTVLGVLVLADDGRSSHRTSGHIEAFVKQCSLPLARVLLAENARAAALRADAERIRGSLLSAVSHDLRTPLATIAGAASALCHPGKRVSSEQRADLASTICTETERLQRLVSSLVDMSRLEGRRSHHVALDVLMPNTLTRMASELDGRPVTLDMPPLPTIEGDPVLLEQVLLNLLDNATKHTPPRTAISIRGRTIEHQVEITISDAGLGLQPGTEERIFERFFRSSASDVPGSGLGLSICRAIVEAHGGSLLAENVPDGGAMFRIILPAGHEGRGELH